jgi:uncharacterized Zn-binding protein involved in type VI secretion
MHAMVDTRLALSVVIMLAALASAGRAEDGQSPTAAVGVVTSGSGTVSVGGQAAAGTGDTTDGAAAIVEGSSNVFIGGKPAATVGDRTGCGGIIIGGSSNVFVNGKPLARAGDLTTGCPGN